MLEDINNGRSDAAPAPTTGADQEYKVGPGRPPKEYQFKKGQSGNPKGAKRKKPSIELDLKAALEHALNKPVTLKQGDKERTVTMAVAAIQQLVAQAAKGDRHARRDLFWLADQAWRRSDGGPAASHPASARRRPRGDHPDQCAAAIRQGD